MLAFFTFWPSIELMAIGLVVGFIRAGRTG
jgi:hypothetical protein